MEMESISLQRLAVPSSVQHSYSLLLNSNCSKSPTSHKTLTDNGWLVIDKILLELQVALNHFVSIDGH